MTLPDSFWNLKLSYINIQDNPLENKTKKLLQKLKESGITVYY